MFAIVIGKREQGKSTLSLFIAREWSERVMIFDPRRQFNQGYITHDFVEFQELLDERDARIVVYQPLSEDDDSEFVFIAREALARGFVSNPSGKFVLLVDEAQDLAKTGQSMQALSRFVRKTKTDTAALVMNFHRPADVATIFKALPTDMFIFRTTLGNDIAWLKENVGEDVADRVRQLPDHIFIHVKVDRDKWRIIDTPESWFVPLEGKIERRNLYAEVQAGR